MSGAEGEGPHVLHQGAGAEGGGPGGRAGGGGGGAGAADLYIRMSTAGCLPARPHQMRGGPAVRRGAHLGCRGGQGGGHRGEPPRDQDVLLPAGAGAGAGVLGHRLRVPAVEVDIGCHASGPWMPSVGCHPSDLRFARHPSHVLLFAIGRCCTVSEGCTSGHLLHSFRCLQSADASQFRIVTTARMWGLPSRRLPTRWCTG